MGLPIIGDLINSVTDIVGKVVVDKDKRNELNFEIQKLGDLANQRAHDEIMAQIEVNKVEASSGSIFVAGWRPAVGWVCAAGLAAQVIILPLLDRIFHWSMPFDTELLILTMSGMLGIGGMRTYEKVKGVSTNDYTDTPQYPKDEPGKPKSIIPIDIPWLK